MPASSSTVAPSPVAIKRLPWMRRLSFISPKLSRLLTLFSYNSLSLWAYVESQSAITRFCEYPGFVIVDGHRLLATFCVEGPQHRQFLVLEGDIELVPEHPQRVPTYSDAEVFIVTPAWLEPHKQWIENWHQINPYIVCNARFVTAQMLEVAANLIAAPMALFDIEHAMQRRLEQQLARTAVFMLLHQGRLASVDLVNEPLSGSTRFFPSTMELRGRAP